jgi:ribosomal protein S18 acetylase RimI-like enzyme
MSQLTIELVEPPLVPEIFDLLRLGSVGTEGRRQLDIFQRWSREAPTGQLVGVVARRERKLVAALLAQLQPGHLATVWGPSQLASESSVTIRKLAAKLRRLLRGHGISLLQAVLPLDEGVTDEGVTDEGVTDEGVTDEGVTDRLLRTLGFRPVAVIAYLVGTVERSSVAQPEWLDTPGGFDGRALYRERDAAMQAPQELPLSIDAYREEEDWDELCEIVTATYDQSQDCPEVNDLREVADVLTGYRGASDTTRRRWNLVRQEGRAVGCCLFAEAPRSEPWELVYWGLIPEVRGRGWGMHLMRWVLKEVERGGGSSLLLAVDVANAPATRIYQQLGFFLVARRRVLIAHLGS